MGRFVLLTGAAMMATAVTAAGAPAIEMYSIRGPWALGEEYRLGILDGKVWLPKNPTAHREWTAWRVEGKGALIRVTSSDRRDKYHHWYLSYDPTGKDRRVFLSKKPGPGSYWDVGRSVEDNAHRTIRASAGKVKGLYLDAGRRGGGLKDVDGKPLVAHQAVLSDGGRVAPEFLLVRIAP